MALLAAIGICGEGVAAAPSGDAPDRARVGRDNTALWRADMLNWQNSPVDLSFLNARERPAGRHGFLKVAGNALAFEDGTPARFWGTNVTAAALFQTPPDEVRRQVRRISAMGFNLVRLHHHDSLWVKPNVFGEAGWSPAGQLNARMLEKLDWWIKCLKDQGVYVWLDLHVQRHLTRDDRIEGFDEIRKGQPTAELKGYNYVNAGIEQAMQRFNADYVNHVNVHTNIRHRDEPAIIAMLITNENDMTHHFGNLLLPDKRVPVHAAMYARAAAAFADQWRLPRDRVWRSWELGPSKLFLNDLEFRFNARMIAHLRAQGVRVPLVTTSTWGNPLSSLPALTAGNLIDAHAYGGTGELETDPLRTANMMHWLASAQIAGMPLSVSEWNVQPFPVSDRHVIPMYLAASARLQGWAAMLQYAYTQVPVTGAGRPSNWAAYNDPSLAAVLPAAALLFRRGDVLESGSVYAYSPTQEQLFHQSITPANAAGLRTAAERGKLVIALPATRELPWLRASVIPAGAQVIRDPSQPLLPSGADEGASDSGELRRNWKQGIFTIDTPRTQAAMGRIGGRSLRLADVDIAAETPNATVAIQSLSDEPISKSGAILISLAGRSIPSAEGPSPYRSEPVQAQLSIRARPGLRIYAKEGSGPKIREIPARYDQGRYQISLQRDLGTYWLELR